MQLTNPNIVYTLIYEKITGRKVPPASAALFLDEFFKKKDGVGQEALFNVMKAYSVHDREVGYCQGSAFIVGLLLMQVGKKTLLMKNNIS